MAVKELHKTKNRRKSQINTTTIKEIAQVAGVSYATVSLALRGHPRISDKRKKQIRKIAEQLDYRPNLLVRGLVGGDTYTVGIITTSLDVEALANKITSFEDSARKKGYLSIIAFNPNDPTIEDRLIDELLQRGVDGFVIYPTEYGEHRKLKELVDKNFPIVTFNGNGRLEFKTHDVSLDYYEGGRLQIKHLAEIGRKRIGYVLPVFTCYTIEQRVLGAESAARDIGVDFHLIRIDTGSSGQRAQTEQAYVKVKEYFRENVSRFDAIACQNDLFALSVIRALHKLGVKVPDDIAVIGFDNVSASEFSIIPISTIHQHADVLGRIAFEILEKLLRSKNTKNLPNDFIRITLKPELIVRTSTVGEIPANR